MNTELTQEVMNLVKKHKLLGSGSNEDFKEEYILTDTLISLKELNLGVGSLYVSYNRAPLTESTAIQVAVALLNNVIYPK